MFNRPHPTFNEHPVSFSELPNIHSKRMRGIFLNIQAYRRNCKETSVTVTSNVLCLCVLGVTLVLGWRQRGINQRDINQRDRFLIEFD